MEECRGDHMRTLMQGTEDDVVEKEGIVPHAGDRWCLRHIGIVESHSQVDTTQSRDGNDENPVQNRIRLAS